MSLRPSGINFDFGLGYLFPSRTSDVYPSYGAITTDLGLGYPVPLRSLTVLLGAGGSFVLNSNGSGDGAPYARLGALYALSPRVSIRADLAARYWLDAGSIGAGLDVAAVWLPKPNAPTAARRGPGDAVFDGWVFGAAANLLAVSQATWEITLWGPQIAASRITAGGFGFETGLSYVAPSGFYGFNGVSLDLGLVYSARLRASSLVLLRLGGTGLVGGDSDGSGGGAGALYPGVGFIQQISGPIGVRVDVTPRLWVSEDAAVTLGASAGLVVRP
jgi:hypothetical protein